VLRWSCALLVAVVLSGFAFLLVTGRYISDGPVIATVAPAHGLHAGDLVVIGGWAVSMLALLRLAWLPGRTARR